MTEKKGGDHLLTKTMANFSSSSVGSGMGTFRGMMWCFISDWPSTLSMFPIFNFKKKPSQSPNFLFPKLENPNSQIIQRSDQRMNPENNYGSDSAKMWRSSPQNAIYT